MPKVVTKKKPDKGFTLEFNTLASGPYDQAFIFHGPMKIAQLTLIRCEESKELIQALKKAGIKAEVS